MHNPTVTGIDIAVERFVVVHVPAAKTRIKGFRLLGSFADRDLLI